MKARHSCAVLGVAIAVGIVAFMESLVATNDHQSLARAEATLASPFFSELRALNETVGLRCARFSLDWRPNGRVMQGPPMVVTALSPVKNPSVNCSAASTPDAVTNRLPEVVITSALFAQRRLSVPPVGTELRLVGRRSAYRVRIRAIDEQERAARGLPNMFILFDDAKAITEEWSDWKLPTAAELAPSFMSDTGRNFDRAKALLLWAAALTALCLIVNSLILSVEARRRELAILRTLGLTRLGVVGAVTAESLALTAVGLFLGVVIALTALAGYTVVRPAEYPSGWVAAWKPIALVGAIAPFISFFAVLFALRSALAVRPLEAASKRPPRRRRLGMIVSFACGFGAFVAVEVWGTSLTKPFIPSPEWPDAIVSILPGGVSAFEIEKLRQLEGVRRIAELQPLQVNLDPLEEMKGARGPSRAPQYRNALLLASDWLPNFRFVQGERGAAEKALADGDNCLITAMMARAHGFKLGDELRLDAGRGLKITLRIVGIVDLNWHLVTSRGLVRGLNRMPVNTDGPVFVSFDTLAACDLRPQPYVKMTHLWLDFEPDFLAAHGVFPAGRLVESEIALALASEENTVRLHSRDEVADGTLAHGTDLVGEMARVPFVFIAVVSLGFIAMLVASAQARRREFAVLRAVGATRLDLARILFGEALFVAWRGLFFGLVGGALVGYLATSGTRAAMSNWGIPAAFDLPVVTCLEGAVGALVFAFAISIPTCLAYFWYNIRHE